MSNATMTSETAPEMILRELSEFGPTEPQTLARIVQSDNRFSPRVVSASLMDLIRTGLVVQQEGARGWYQLTDKGRAAAGSLPAPRTLREIITHPGGSAFDVETGRLVIGRNAYGEDVSLQLWNEIGAKALLVSGSTGAGGTNLLGGLIEATLPHYPLVRTWVIDSVRQMGEYWDQVEKVAVNDLNDEFGGLFDPFNRATTTSELLDQVIVAQRDRLRLLRSSGRKAWNGPLNELRMPLGLLIIGQLDEVAGDREQRAKLAIIGKMARKTGTVVAAHVHSPILESFGHDMGIADFFRLGNVVALRHASALFGKVLSGTDLAFPDVPSTFPDGSTTAGVGSLGDGKLFRTFWASGL
jgi:hypothetical protein